MEKEDFISDEFLMDLFRGQPFESPGKDFTGNVMEQILRNPETAKVNKPFYKVFISWWPYIVLSLFTLIFLMTSDLPFTDFVPGKEFFTKQMIPYLGSVFSGFMPVLSNMKVILIPSMVVLAIGLLVGLDHFLFRKPAIRQQSMQ